MPPLAVEDTYNLLGYALRKALGVIARQHGQELAPGTRWGCCVIWTRGWSGTVGIMPANAAEASATDDLLADLPRQDVQLREIHLDRGYLASDLVRNRPEDLIICCKAWRVLNGDRYAKTAFVLDWEAGTIR